MDEPIRLAQSPSLAKLPLLQNTVFQTMPAGFRFGAHSHRNVELILVTRGSCTINVWKESIQLRPGEYMAPLSSAVHTFTVCKEASCSFWQLHFAPELCKLEPTCACMWNTTPDQLSEIIADLSDECAQQGLYSVLYRNLLLGRLGLFLEREYSSNAKTSLFTPNPHVRRALEYLSAHYRQKLTLDEVATACGISRRYLSRLFYADTHTTVADYANLLRINKAVDLLRDTDLAVSTISSRLGFSSVQYFSKLFKELTGFSPRAIRESFLPRSGT